MLATLIKLETKKVNVPDHRPIWREIVRENGIPLSANYEGMDINSLMEDVKFVDYRVIRIKGGEHGENGNYLVNDDMWYAAMPIINDIIEQQITPLRKENVDLRVEVAYLNDVVRAFEKSICYRFKCFIKKYFQPKKAQPK